MIDFSLFNDVAKLKIDTSSLIGHVIGTGMESDHAHELIGVFDTNCEFSVNILLVTKV